MELLVQDQARDLADKRACLLGATSEGQRNSCSSCPHHFFLRHSALKQAELGDPMTPQMERGACGQAEKGYEEKDSSQREALLNGQNV